LTPARRPPARTTVSDAAPLSVTFDLEDSRRSSAQEERFVAMSDRFLQFAADRHITATVFVVGEIARSHPALVRRVAAAGHEVALHGLRHVPLGVVGRGKLRAELHEGRMLLEDAAQAPVTGFRAPIFSLTPATAWAVEDIRDAGFRYSSSVLPAVSPLHGWPGAPRTPFRWHNSVLELPCPVAGVGRLCVPYLGGIYMRYVPTRVAALALARQPAGAVAWTYCHPYDLDPDEPFGLLPASGWLTSRLVHTRRGATLRRLDALLAAAGGAGPTLAQVSERLAADDLPVVS
jgi:polysaccharide deacetylase family protein (PEP-CTERM system associated)